MARIDRSIKRKVGYLIGDSAEYGSDQVISRNLYISGLVDHKAMNQRNIEEALASAEANGFTNIRCEIINYVALAIPQGVLGWKEVRRRVVPFTEKVRKQFIV